MNCLIKNFWDFAATQLWIDEYDMFNAQHGGDMPLETRKLVNEYRTHVRNTLQGECQVWDFEHNPPAIGESYAAYLFEAKQDHPAFIGTWMSDELMTVISQSRTWIKHSSYGPVRLWSVQATDSHGYRYRGIASNDRDILRMKRVK